MFKETNVYMLGILLFISSSICLTPDEIASGDCRPMIAKLDLEEFDPRIRVNNLLAQLRVLRGAFLISTEGVETRTYMFSLMTFGLQHGPDLSWAVRLSEVKRTRRHTRSGRFFTSRNA